jgi:hypothetical protein
LLYPYLQIHSSACFFTRHLRYFCSISPSQLGDKSGNLLPDPLLAVIDWTNGNAS